MLLDKLKAIINNTPLGPIYFFTLCSFFLNAEISGNEEIYLGWAKAYYDPTWMPNSFVYDHWVGHRYLFEIFFGFLLKHFSFGIVVVIGKILAAAAMAYALSKLFRQIKLSNLESLLIVVVFISCGQNILPGEWIFMSVESKVFAYPLIFLSLAELLKGNPKIAAFYIMAATYFHVIVAGWFFIYFIVYLIWTRTNLPDVARAIGIYIAGVLPLAIYLVPRVLSGPSDVNGIHLNWIYVYYRIPNLAPFVNGKLNTAASWEAIEILTVAFCFILAIIFHRKNSPIVIVNPFNRFIIIIGTFIFTFLCVAYFDHSGDILKFRPFRADPVFLFFVLIQLFLLITLKMPNEKAATFYSKFSILLLVILMTYKIGDNINRKYIKIYFMPDEKTQAWEDATSFAKNNTQRDSIFFIQGVRENIDWTFTRLADRDVFVSKKFNPVDKDKWYEWYQRLQVEVKDETQMAALKNKYKLDYFITSKSKPVIGKTVYQNSHFVISRLSL
jgi:hypothetical protein